MYAGHFSLENIPFGVASSASHPHKSVATRVGDTVFYLEELAKAGLLKDIQEKTTQTFSSETVNAFAALSKSEQRNTRAALQKVLSAPLEKLPSEAFTPVSEATLHLPLAIGDITDFSCSRDHNLNAAEAIAGRRVLPEGFEYFPGGYTARSSSIVVSGTKVRRPKGQFRDGDRVTYGPTRRLDYELEIACVIGKGSKLGETVHVADADEHIFGLVLLNDWSARDVQALEMFPLGPLNGKSFTTSISPWIVTLDALAPFKSASPKRNADIQLAPYLQDPDTKSSYDIDLTATLENSISTNTICKTKFSSLYWTLRDLVAHQTANGCSISTGDLLATGTVSETSAESHGCLMELAVAGGIEVKSASGQLQKKMWLEDGDAVRISGLAGPGVGFGDCYGEISPAT
ncbi:fumarylacetoacetate hydrolase [Phlyctema vagabunda]|uniref:Fumarylacetoacetase n=1 Tax=Phlyctema vagabunda TaxID=108571 RepID=A0ABR4PFK0_9HELO